jgi:hypothetical protein
VRPSCFEQRAFGHKGTSSPLIYLLTPEIVGRHRSKY